MMDREAYFTLTATVPCGACRDRSPAAIHEPECYVSRRVKMSADERAAHDAAIDAALAGTFAPTTARERQAVRDAFEVDQGGGQTVTSARQEVAIAEERVYCGRTWKVDQDVAASVEAWHGTLGARS